MAAPVGCTASLGRAALTLTTGRRPGDVRTVAHGAGHRALLGQILLNENDDSARLLSLLSSTQRADDAGHFFAMACGQSGSFIRISTARAIIQSVKATCITSYAFWNAARAPSRSPAPSRFQPIT